MRMFYSLHTYGRVLPVKPASNKVYIIPLIVSIIKFSIVIGHPRAYFVRNWRVVTWASNNSCPIRDFRFRGNGWAFSALLVYWMQIGVRVSFA